MEETFGAPEDAIRLSLPAVFTVTFLVYFRLGSRGVPDKAAMLRTVDAWLERCGDPARAAIREFIAKGMLLVKAGRRGDVICPPWETLWWFRPGETEERRFKEASHLVAVGAQDWLGAPRVGLWVATAAARALAEALDGVMIDGFVPRLIPCASHRDPVPSDFRVHVRDHAVVPVSISSAGLAWVTTKGLARFGLPDLQVEHVPSAVADSNAIPILVLGVAQWLLETCMKQAGHPVGESVELRLPSEVTIGWEEIARAYASGKPDAARNVGRRTLVGLRWDPDTPRGTFLSLVPPGSFEGGQSAWLYRAAEDLLGPQPDPITRVSDGDEEMGAAHRRALAELPAIRERFRTGLPKGCTLYVKRPFRAGVRGEDTEMMWVQVLRWKGGHIEGELANSSPDSTEWHAGRPVEFAEAEAYDWILYHPDGRHEGGYTTDLLQDRAGG